MTAFGRLKAWLSKFLESAARLVPHLATAWHVKFFIFFNPFTDPLFYRPSSPKPIPRSIRLDPWLILFSTNAYLFVASKNAVSTKQLSTPGMMPQDIAEMT